MQQESKTVKLVEKAERKSNSTRNSSTLTAHQFLTELTRFAPKNTAPIYTAFESRPGAKNALRSRWSGTPLQRNRFANGRTPGRNNAYTTVSSFTDGKRRKASFAAMLAVMIDDPGTKIDLEKIALEPSVWLETSPGNFQAWYFLTEPVTDRKKAESVLNALIASGLTDDGKDPGMAGVTRYGRVPESINNKSTLKKPHNVVGRWGRGKKRYSIEEIIEAFELQPVADEDAASCDRTQDISSDGLETGWTFLSDPLGAFTQKQGLIKGFSKGKVEVTCPWVEEHTGGVDDGTAFIVNENGSLGFKCHHGHCQEKGLKDVWAWAKENGYKGEKTESNADDAETGIYEQVRQAHESDNPERAKIDLIAKYPNLSWPLHQYGKLVDKERDQAEQRERAIKALCSKKWPERLDISKLLTGDGGTLADAIAARAKALPTAPEFIFASTIPVLASQMGTKQTLLARRDSNQLVTAIFWVMIVGRTGDAKSPAMRIATSALYALEAESRDSHQKAVSDYELMESFSDENDGEPAEAAPIRKRYLVSDSTPAVRIKIHSENRTGYAFIKDEGSAFLTEIGRHSSKGSDNGEKEQMLSEFDGDALQYDRKGSNGKAEDLGADKTAVQRLGGTQWETLKKLRGDHSDSSGLWARFLFCGVATPKAIATVDSGKKPVDLEGMVKALVRRIEALESAEYTYTPEAQALAIRFQNYLTELGEDADDCERSAFPKFKTYLHRFALFFHVLNGVLGRDPEGVVGAEISTDTVKQAIHCLRFFIGQYQVVLNINSDDRKEAGNAEILLRYIKRKGADVVTARQIVRSGCLSARGVKSKAEYDAQLNLLVDAGRLKKTDEGFQVVG